MVIVVGLSFPLLVFCCVLALGVSHFKMSFCIHININLAHNTKFYCNKEASNNLVSPIQIS